MKHLGNEDMTEQDKQTLKGVVRRLLEEKASFTDLLQWNSDGILLHLCVRLLTICIKMGANRSIRKLV